MNNTQSNTPGTTPAREVKPIQWDKLESTFWWKISLDMSNPENRVAEMDGYSHAIGFDEGHDKRQVLMRAILRLHSRGYFNRIIHIRFYKRTGNFIDKSNSKLLFILTPTEVKNIHEDVMEDPQLINWLDKLYQLIRDGGDVKMLLPTPARLTKDDYLDPDKQFSKIRTDELRLFHYCSSLIRSGHSFQEVHHFCLKYKEKFIR